MEFYGFFPFPANTIHGVGLILCPVISYVAYAIPADFENSKFVGFLRLFFVLSVFALMYYLLIDLSGQDLSHLANKYLRQFYDYISHSYSRKW